jgi:RpiR family carbohydrate utilization transcriptional regulator
MSNGRKSHGAGRRSTNVLETVRAAMPSLRKSDAKVAQLVLDVPHWFLDATVAETAERAGVSQPTVIRFCAAIGFSGFQEFKLRLAQTLAIGRSATHSVISGADSLGSVTEKIFEYTLSSLDWARQHLDRAALQAAVRLLSAARSIEFFGYGASGIVAEDAGQKFPLFGVPCRAQPDFHQQIMAASMMRPRDLAVVISNTGRTRQIVEVAALARANGAKIIGLVGAEGPISALCDATLLVETLDNTNVYTPTTSRIAALVVIDILSTAVALGRDDAHNARLQEMKRRLNKVRAPELDADSEHPIKPPRKR